MYLLKKNIYTTTMKTNIRFTFLIVKLIPFVLLSQLRSLPSSESNMSSFFTSSLHPLQLCSSVLQQQCCSIDCIEHMQFGFRFLTHRYFVVDYVCCTINVTKNKQYWCHGYLLLQNADSRLQTGCKIQTADCRVGTSYL